MIESKKVNFLELVSYQVSFRNENFNKLSMLYKAINDEEISPDFYIKNGNKNAHR